MPFSYFLLLISLPACRSHQRPTFIHSRFHWMPLCSELKSIERINKHCLSDSTEPQRRQNRIQNEKKIKEKERYTEITWSYLIVGNIEIENIRNSKEHRYSRSTSKCSIFLKFPLFQGNETILQIRKNRRVKRTLFYFLCLCRIFLEVSAVLYRCLFI